MTTDEHSALGVAVDRDVGPLPRYSLRPRLVDGRTLIFRDDFDSHGDWTPWAQAQAELDRLRALLKAVQREVEAGRGVSEETATAIDAALGSVVPPNAALCGHREGETR